MYDIKRRPSGYILTFSGKIDPSEMQNWKEDSQNVLSNESSKSFGVIIDMRDLHPLTPDSQSIMVNGQELYKEKGMNRSAVILANSILSLQFKRLAKESGIYTTERYIDATKYDNPIKTAIDWVKDGINPED